MDIQHIYHSSPIQPLYENHLFTVHPAEEIPMEFVDFPGGRIAIGAPVNGRFAFDCERPRHEMLIPPYRLANRLITNGDFLEFMDAGGYENPDLWLADGWATKRREDWAAPMYWEKIHGDWFHFTLRGRRKLVFDEPVSHISYYEASAFARWFGARLPTEFEWETAAASAPMEGNFQEEGMFHPSRPTRSLDGAPLQMFGDLWEWTSSTYAPYPGHRRSPGFLGEYNSKFMCNQMVLRGGSFATPRHHLRATYRNFYDPAMRWQFAGLRLAKDWE